jgi:ABC-2 type transport system permease protein
VSLILVWLVLFILAAFHVRSDFSRYVVRCIEFVFTKLRLPVRLDLARHAVLHHLVGWTGAVAIVGALGLLALAAFRCLKRRVPATIRLMMVKDVRLFWRDPLQWSQIFIFAGFMIVYSLYIPSLASFTPDLSTGVWSNMVSFLNLAVVGLMLSTYTTRFVFPLISLEGRRFWILGQIGVGRGSVLWGKFLLAVCGALVPCSCLVLLSDMMLRTATLIVLSHQLTCLVLCFGLAGIAVGLGALLPNLREESPSRIAAGFGGTLTLVTSTLFVVAVVLLTALPTHFYFAAICAKRVSDFGGLAHFQSWFMWWWIAGTSASVLVGGLATCVPMLIGFRAFRRQEF